MYLKGQGVEKNELEAFKWYCMAAQQGLVQAQFNLGVMYENGRGVEKNELEACKWLQMAADQGLREAQWALRRVGL
jgi:TPR repeat protein